MNGITLTDAQRMLLEKQQDLEKNLRSRLEEFGDAAKLRERFIPLWEKTAALLGAKRSDYWLKRYLVEYDRRGGEKKYQAELMPHAQNALRAGL